MISVADARRLLEGEVPPPEPCDMPLADARGLVLAEEIASDMDLPPFAKSMMDGYALMAEDLQDLEVVEEIHAGQVPQREIRPGLCAKIMTGAPMPAGADAVQQVEKTVREGNRVRLLAPAKRGHNVAERGHDLKKGEVALRPGRPIGPAALGLLAAVGRTSVSVFRRPSLALLVTGDEIVEPGEPVGPGKIRNSNAYSLLGQMAEAGFPARYLGVVGDREAEIREKIREGLTHDVLIVSGGVSAGDRDLVVPCLEAEGVAHRMHRVSIKPGKPFFFGTLGRRRVFGLPGNPVSTFVTFEVFVRPFLGTMCGLDLERPRVRTRLLSAAPSVSDREQYLPAVLESGGVQLHPWKGSADLKTLVAADGLVVVPPGARLSPEDQVEVMRIA